MVPKINPKLVERIEKRNTFEVAGFVVPDTLYHVTISVFGITFVGLLAYRFTLGLFLVPLGIVWLVAIYFSFIFTLVEVKRSPEEYADLFDFGQEFFHDAVISTSIVNGLLLIPPMFIWGLPILFRNKEIEAIEEKVYAFQLEDLLYE